MLLFGLGSLFNKRYDFDPVFQNFHLMMYLMNPIEFVRQISVLSAAESLNACNQNFLAATMPITLSEMNDMDFDVFIEMFGNKFQL